MRSKLYSLIAAALIGISGCSDPSIKRIEDLTGDGICDVLIHNNSFFPSEEGDYLLIGQKDGSFVSAKKYEGGQRNGPTYFMTNDYHTYFFDGKNYIECKKEAEGERK